MGTVPSNILVVNEDNDVSLRRVFESRYHVTSVDDGTGALNALSEKPFDAVILDVQDGVILDVLCAIRQQPGATNTPVLLVMNRKNHRVVARGFEMGANDYIWRPINAQLALSRVRAQVEMKKKLDAQAARIHELEALHDNHERLVRIIRHDLKNPIANLRMAEAILRRDAYAQDHTILDSVHVSIDAVQEIVEEFTVAYSAQQGIVLKPENIWADELLYDVILQFMAAAEKKGIQIHLRQSANCLIADRARLSQVMSNLISNALKYSPPDSLVQVWSQSNGGHVRLCVRDAGTGIPERERHLLFTEFGKLSPRPTGQEGSTGLGLWIVKTLTEAMNGIVGTDFPAGGGSIFWIALPSCN